MLKLVKFLKSNQKLVVLFLMTPLIGFLFSSRFVPKMVPSSPYTHYQVVFEVPARPAKEIAVRVTEPSEKIFNGLPGLLSLDSETYNEKAIIDIVFKKELNPKNAYLFLQEKMDQIRLVLPRDVETYTINKITIETPSELKIKFKDEMQSQKLHKELSVFKSSILKTMPSLDEQLLIEVMPKMETLIKHKLSISQILSSLKSSGLQTTIGRQSGILFETGAGFKSIDDLNGTIVGSSNNTPIKLSDISNTIIRSPKTIKEIEVWYDHARVSKNEIVESLKLSNIDFTIENPYLSEILHQTSQPLDAIIIIFLFQILLIKILFGKKLKLLPLVIFDLSIIIHFLFWKGIISGEVTVLDLHTLILIIMMGTLFWVVLLSRIKSYLITDNDKPLKSIEQATLFSLVELFPTFIILLIAFWLISLPLLSSGINLPSYYILNSFFYYGCPVLLLVLLIMPIVGETDWFENTSKTLSFKLNWNISNQMAYKMMWGLILLAISSFYFFKHMGIGIIHTAQESKSIEMVNDLRGYDEFLTYIVPKEDRNDKSDIIKKNEFELTRNWTVSSSGMRFISDLDLIGFHDAINDIQRKKPFGNLIVESDKIPLFLSAGNIEDLAIGKLFLASQKENKSAFMISTITQPNIELTESQILRSKLIVSDRVKMSGKDGFNLRKKLETPYEPTQWSDHILFELNNYDKMHIVSLVFLFFLFSFNFNSFIRGGIVFFFVLSPAALIFIIRSAMPGVYYADSLWFLYLAPIMGLFSLLCQSKIIDIERTRGLDRDVCISNVQKHLTPSLVLCIWFFVICLVIMGVLERISFIPSLGLWNEAIFIGLFGLLFSWLTNRYLFPIFYITSEELIDGILFRIYKVISLKWKSKS